MIVIKTLSGTRFTLNGIQYFKNYISAVYGNKIEIFNCYERKDVLLPQTHFNQFTVDGVYYSDAASLQSALLGVIYYRENLANGGVINDQDNIDIKKTFKILPNQTNQEILAKINNLPTYTVSEKQSVWFVGIELGMEVICEIGGTNMVNYVYDPRVVKYKMMNKGKGDYGIGALQLTLNDIELVYERVATDTDIIADPTTDTFSFGTLSGMSISEWLNTANPSIIIQPQDQGYTLFKGVESDFSKSYLWIGAPGLYGSSALQASISDFQIISDTVTNSVEQDNIDIRKAFNYLASDTTLQILSKINALASYSVNEKQSVWFTGHRSVGTVRSATPPVTCMYKMMNNGKGVYGLGGTQLSLTDIELIYHKPFEVQEVESDPLNTITSLGNIPDGNYLSVANNTEWDFSDSDRTYYFSYTHDSILYIAEFVGSPSIYGGSDLDTSDFSAGDFITSSPGVSMIPGVQSITGPTVDNSDPLYPIINLPTPQQLFEYESTVVGLSSPIVFQTNNGELVKGKIKLGEQGLELSGQSGGVYIAGDIDGVFIFNLKKIYNGAEGFIEVDAGNKGLIYNYPPGNLQNLSLVHKGYVDIKANSSEQSTITFDKPTIYNSPTIPASYDGFTSVLTNARIGVIQKIYHLDNVIPVFPANWVLIGYGTYVTNVLNIIYAEWIEDERVEYWIIQQA
ncbi:MAG: hypothetical protein EOO85_03915 [Pedobacter sp.]|nr:MAG: hypothetical protein EOO85_03915 [Pedobacter sp.]